MVISPTLNQWGSLGPLMVYSRATLHVGLTRFVRTTIYFKCISKFRIWRELLCLLKCKVHSVLVMRKRFWRSWHSVAVVSWTSSSSVCACFNVKADLAILAFGRCVFFTSFLSFCLFAAFHVLSCVRLFVHFYNYIFCLMFVQFSAGGSV